MFHLGMRFDADVVEWVEERGELKRFAGHPMFAFSVLRTWLKTPRKDTPMHVVLQGANVDVETDSAWLVALNTNPYSFVGSKPFSAAPSASLDGALSVLSFDNVTARSVVGAAYRSLFTDKGVRGLKHVQLYDDVETGVMTSQKSIGVQMDGDHIGESERVEFGVTRDAIKLVRPVAQGDAHSS